MTNVREVGPQNLTQTYEQGITLKATDTVASSNPAEYDWIPAAQTVIRGLLKPIEGSSEFVLGAFAHLGHDGLHVYVLDTMEEYNHNYALALGLLELDLGKKLRSKFRTVTLHTIPASGLRDEEVGYYHNGVNLF